LTFKDFAKGAIAIAVAQILVGVGNFLILPIVTRTLGPHEYGIWITITVTVMLLTHFGVLGLSSAILRFIPSKINRKEISEEFFTILTFVAVLSMILGLIVMGFSKSIADELMNDGSLSRVITIASLLIPLSAINAVNVAFIRAIDRIKTFVILSVLSAYSQLTLILVMANMGLMGVVSAILLSMTLMCVLALILIIQQVGFSRPRIDILLKNLRFGLPLAPSSIIAWVNDSGDRYLVAGILGMGAAGVYSAAWGIGSVVFQIIVPIQMVLYPTMSKMYDEGQMENVKSYLSRSLRYFLILTIPAVVGMTVLAGPLLVALTTPAFASGAIVIPFIAVSALMAGIIEVVTVILLLVKKTHLNLIVYIIPAIINVILVLIVAPHLGIMGAAMASTVSYLILLYLGVKVSFAHLQFTIDWSSIAKSVASSILMAIIIAFISPTTMIGILISILAGVSTYFGAMIIMKGVTREELDFAKGALGKANSRM